MKLYADFTKIDEEKRMVHGYASTEAMDSQGEIVSKQAIHEALPDYLKFGNIREMHQNSAVGVTLGAEVDDKGLYLHAHVVDDDAWKKVKAKVYKGFSIGGRATARDPLNKKIITGLDLNEVSLVDRPANPEALIDFYKMESGDLSKEGKRNSAEDQAMIQAMHDHACALGAACSGTANVPGAAKMDNGDDLRKLQSDLADLRKVYEELKAAPAPAKAVLKAIAKEADTEGTAEEKVLTPLEEIKKAHRNPIRIT